MKKMHHLSPAVRLAIGGSIFALVIALIIIASLSLLFWYNGMHTQVRHALPKTLVIIGFYAVWDTYRIWKKFKAEQNSAEK